MSDLQTHPAAHAFPMMSEQRYADLRESIRVNGQREPITLCDGMILDGRNRHRACVELGLSPRTRVHDGDPWLYAWDLNGNRRDINDDQRFLAWKFCSEGSEAWKLEKQALAAESSARRAAAAGAQPRNPDGTMAPAMQWPRQPPVPHADPNTASSNDNARPADKHRTRSAKAKASYTNTGAVARGEKLVKDRPDLAEKVRLGEMKPAEAQRQMKRDTVASKVEALPASKYRVIYADPPWQYNDSRGGLEDYSKTAAEDHYPTMPTSEICALDVRSLAADDAVLFCWATFPLLTDALEVVRAWGFKYKTAFVWAKGRTNFGHYHTADAELLLVATRGSGITPDAEKRERQVQAVERTGRHSEKPEEFRAMVDRLYTHGKRIELFRRGEAPSGWEIWGNEAKS